MGNARPFLKAKLYASNICGGYEATICLRYLFILFVEENQKVADAIEDHGAHSSFLEYPARSQPYDMRAVPSMLIHALSLSFS